MPRQSLILLSVILALVSGFPTSAVSLFAAAKEKVLHVFGKCKKDGAWPEAGLISDAAGNLYSTTRIGGAHGWGTVFQLTPDRHGKWTSKVLHSFNNYATPYGGLVFDAKGNLYGTTSQGGPHGLGTVFELTPSASGKWTETTLHSFSGPDGSSPHDTLVFDAAGNLYGTTLMGGAYGWGTVFQLRRGKNGKRTEKVLHSFNTNGDGYNPEAGLIFDKSGNLYGTTYYGGSECRNWGCGTVFELSPGPKCKWTEKVLHSFGSYYDGGYPWGGLIFDPAGNLYGTTTVGGGGFGTVFQLTPSGKNSWNETVLHSFSGDDGFLPLGSLVLDAAGNLYGTTSDGGNYGGWCADGCGVVFKLTPGSNGGWTETTLYKFNVSGDGHFPVANLIFDAAGNLLGTTVGGGDQDGCNYNLGCGTVFELIP